MINNLSNFCISIICASVFIIIIKMIIPDNKNRKYILFVCSLVMLTILLEPILNIWNFDMDEVLAKNEEHYKEIAVDDSFYENAIKSTYEKNLIQDIINRLKENGYEVSNVKVEYDTSFKPTKIYLNLGTDDGYVQMVKVEVSKNNSSSIVSSQTKNNIVRILNSNYGIEKNNIFIERSN